MTWNILHSHVKRFRDSTTGSVTLEAVITLPLLVTILVGTYVFHDMFAFKNVREKATFTIADMISRETQPITPAYLDSAKILFDTMTEDNGTNALRVSLATYDGDTDSFAIEWSQVRGAGGLSALTTADVQSAHGELPVLMDGERIIVIDSKATYASDFDVGQGQPTVSSRVFLSPRFAPQVVYEGS